MKIMEKKEISVNGRAVTVHAAQCSDNHLGFLLRAEIDGEAVHSTFTVGPADGIGAENYTPEMLQRDLDAARQKLAEEAEWRSRARRMMEGVS